MQPRWTPISIAVALTLADAIALRRAWAPGLDRPLLWAAAACTIGAGVLAFFAWERLVTKSLGAWLVGRPHFAAAVASAPLAVAIALPLGATYTAQRWVGAIAPWLVAAALLATFVLARAISRPRRRLPPGPRVLAAILAGVLLVTNARLPQTLLVGMHALLIVSAVALLVVALADGVPPSARVPWRAGLAAGVLAALGATILGTSANVRFVAHRQAPVAGLFLRAITPELASHAPARRWAPAAGGTRAPSSWADVNLLIITVDALRADQPLPEVERRAHPGAHFRRVYAQAPHTAWSVTSLLTGAYPDHLTSTPRPITLAEHLRARHFYSDAFYPAGLFFDGRAPLEHYAGRRFGFEWTDTRTLDAHALTDAVLARMALDRRLYADEPRELVWVHYFDPHEPYEAHPPTPADAPPRDRYASEVAYVDREVARLLDGLRGAPRPTLVVLTADHGEELGEHGGAYHGTSVYEEQVRVPLYLFVVGGAPLPDRDVDGPVELVDVMPTVLDLLGEPAPPVEGRSLAPLLFDDEARATRDAHAQVFTRRMLVRDQHKLIHDTRGDVIELYDLARDSAEQHNLADVEPQSAASLKAALADWFALPSIDELERVLADRTRPVERRASAAHLLGELRPPGVETRLRGALGDGDATVRAEAALALAETADRAATPTLLALLDAPAWRKKAALALGHLRDPRAVPALIEATRDIDATTRRHAVHYLGHLAPATTAPLLEARAREDLKVRGDAYLALGRLVARTGDGDAAAWLADRLADETYEDARARLAWALGLAAPQLAPAVARRTRALLAAWAEQPNVPPTVNEALLRLGAAGFDFACHRDPDENAFVGATLCPQRGPTAIVVESPGDAVALVLRARGEGVRETVRSSGVPIGTLPLPAVLGDIRLPLPPGLVRRGRIQLELEPSVSGAELDFVRLVTRDGI
jgi:arylsulfatase A-like enzyme